MTTLDSDEWWPKNPSGKSMEVNGTVANFLFVVLLRTTKNGELGKTNKLNKKKNPSLRQQLQQHAQN